MKVQFPHPVDMATTHIRFVKEDPKDPEGTTILWHGVTGAVPREGESLALLGKPYEVVHVMWVYAEPGYDTDWVTVRLRPPSDRMSRKLLNRRK